MKPENMISRALLQAAYHRVLGAGCLLAFAFYLLPSASISQTSFYQHLITDTDGQAVSVSAADINDDGYMDIVSGTRNGGGQVCWWRNDGYQNFTRYPIDNSFSWVRHVMAGDVNGDDKIDIVGAAFAISTIKLYKNLGQGIFDEEIVDDNFIGAHTVDIKDVNGDSYMDILCSGFNNTSSNSEIAWYKNLENTGWEKNVISARFQQSPFICGADMDGDMDIDVVACGELNGEVYWWENLGDNTFLEHMIDEDFPMAHTVIAKDIDLDGDNDIMGAAWMSGLVAWWENTGYNQFTKHDLGNFGGASWLDCADLDNDGDRDLIGSGQGVSTLSWWENVDMNFTKHSIGGSFSGCFGFTLAPLDSDNDTDIIAAGFNSQKISWFDNLYEKDNFLQGPESIIYDSLYSRYLISNYHTGTIVERDPFGNLTYFNTDFTHVAGLHIIDFLLYAATDQGVAVINLANGLTMTVVEIENSYLLNDITSDDYGHLYITGSVSNKIFKMNTDGFDYHIFVNSGLIYPNGITYQKNSNNLFVMNSGLGNAPILKISIFDSTAVSTEIETQISATDGLTFGPGGQLYFSSWNTGCVYRVDSMSFPPYTEISSGHAGPVDIFYNPIDRMLAIPDFQSNDLDFLYMPPVGIGNEMIKGSTELYSIQISPNPFSETTGIHYAIAQESFVEIEIYNLSGEKIMNLKKGYHSSGEYTVVWNGQNKQGTVTPPGIYICVISDINNGTIMSKKIIKSR